MRLLVLMMLIAGVSAAATAAKPQTQTQNQTQTQPQTGVTVIHEVIQKGTYSGFKDALQQVITNQKDWEELWKKHVSVLVPQPLLPQIDFNTSVVVAIYLGEKKTSGYQIFLKEVTKDGDNIIVKSHKTEPPPNSFTLQVLSQPFLLLRVEKPKGVVQIVMQ